MSARTTRVPSRLLRLPTVGTDARVIAGGGAFGAWRFFAAIFMVAGAVFFAIFLLGKPESWHFAVAPYFIAASAIGLAALWATHRVAAQPQHIRYFIRSAGLWIGYPRRLLNLMAYVVQLIALGTGIRNAVYAYEFFIVDGRGSIFDFPKLAWVLMALIPISVIGFAQLARYVRLPPGILLEERGIAFANSGAGKNAMRTPSWDEIRDIQAEDTGKAHLVIVESSGRRSIISALEMGSDPVTVAAILQFYLQRPQHRSALVEPQEALRCFLTHRGDR